MSRAAKSLFVFACYLAGIGAWLLVHPNSMLGLFGFADAQDVWVRVLGMILLLLAFYYVSAARSELTDFIRWTVHARASVLAFFGAFVLLGLAPAVLLVFGVVDLLAAYWTWSSLRADEAAA